MLGSPSSSHSLQWQRPAMPTIKADRPEAARSDIPS
jgi:hypothetical protein